MTERYGYDPYGQQPRIVGYDDHGRPVLEKAPQQYPLQDQPQPGYTAYQGSDDPYAEHRQQPPGPRYAGGGEGPYDGPYGVHGAHAAHDPYGDPHDPYTVPQSGPEGAQEPQGYGYDWYGPPDVPPQDPQPQSYPQSYPQPQPQSYPQQVRQQQEWIPQQSRTSPEADPVTASPHLRQEAGDGRAEDDAGRAEEGYSAEQFAFIEEPSDASEDVIDWLKFTESRTERREEAKRRGRNRKAALVVVLVLAVLGGTGWAWYAGKLPGLDGGGGTSSSAAGERRDVIVVHLRSTQDDSSSTALLVDGGSEQRGTTVLLPNSLAVSAGDGTTTLAKAVEDAGASPTREGLGRLLGADIKGTWRLDTPYLENLVTAVGGITVETDATVPAAKKGEDPQVRRGRARELDGQAAVAYATYRAPGESQTEQLNRFGNVLQQTLRELSSDPGAAKRTVESLGQVPDPSLSEAQLGATLAGLAERAKSGTYDTRLLPVRGNGTLSRETSEGLVKKVLGGTVRNSDPGDALRVKVTNASGDREADEAASVTLVNGGYTVLGGGSAGASRTRSQVIYGEDAQRAKAAGVATTLGLPDTAVREGESAANADVTVVLGSDYKG